MLPWKYWRCFPTEKNRIALLDAIRGGALIAMVCHHLLFDLVDVLGAPDWLFSNPVFDVLQIFVIFLFLLIAGICTRFSRNNWLRGGKVFLCALLVSVVTTLLNMPIVFGILHCMGISILLFAFIGKALDRIPRPLSLVLYLTAAILSFPLMNGYLIDDPYLFAFGFVPANFISYDFFPLMPWFFVFLLGTWLGRVLQEGRFPRWFYEARAPYLEAIGRKSLWIYLLHQPVLFGVTTLISLLRG